MKKKVNTAKALLDDLEGSGYSDEDYDDFSDDEYYHNAEYRHNAREATPTVKIEDLRRSLNGQASLKQSMDGKRNGDIKQEIAVLLERPGAMQMSDWVVRIPIYVPKTVTDVPPLLVLQFDVQPPYPVSKIPAVSVVTAAAFVSDEAKGYLLGWLNTQAESKLGKQPFVSSLVGLATMWGEIQLESETARLEAQEEAQRRKDALREAAQARKEEEERLIAEADAKAEARRLAGEVEAKPEEEEEESVSSSEDSATKERRGIRAAPAFTVINGAIPPLRNLCIKSFGDNLLLFEGFEEVPIQIRAKVFMYLVQSRNLSHRKLALLVGEDQKRLDLKKCALYVKDHYLDVLEKTPGLTHLSLAKCRLLSDGAFSKLSSCGRLTDLDLRSTNISTSSFTQVVQGCPNLVRVNVSGCRELRGGISHLMSRCDKLTFLFANKCPNLSPEDLFRGLSLAGNWLHTVEATACGSNLLEQKEVRVGYWGQRVVTPTAVSIQYKPLTHPLPNLTVVDLSDNFFVNDHFVMNFFCAPMPSLVRMGFANTVITTKGMLHMCTMAPSLTNFSMTSWSKDDGIAKEEATFLYKFLVAAAKSCRLRDVEIGGSPVLNDLVLKSLFDIHSVTRLHLSKLDVSVGVFSLIPKLGKMQNLQTLRLRNLLVKEVELPVQPGSFSKLQTLQLWDHPTLNDSSLGALLPHFAHIRTFSLRGYTHIKPAGLLEILNRLVNLRTLTIDADTGIAFPLSLFTDVEHAAPIEELNLPKYRLNEIFNNDSLANLHDGRHLDTRLKSLSMDMGDTADRYNGMLNFDITLRVLLFVCPFIQSLDLSHQFVKVFSIVQFVERNGILSLQTCSRHDSAKFHGLDAKRCKMCEVDCSPDKLPVGGAVVKNPWDRLRDEYSSDSEFDYNLFDLFASVGD